MPKVAVTAVFAVSATTHVPAPLQPPPLHPVNDEPDAGGAVSVTLVPLLNDAEHVLAAVDAGRRRRDRPAARAGTSSTVSVRVVGGGAPPEPAG